MKRFMSQPNKTLNPLPSVSFYLKHPVSYRAPPHESPCNPDPIPALPPVVPPHHPRTPPKHMSKVSTRN
ncbi:hypothetical protein BJ508DRAFT_415650 [Ascobolus immersus RN42]|uniref:Uncharacterized protein n=1 Tax=Ascobolus immersus RN42 TaxID=1160509 RepID=A0A3N4I151_ASCIM|nr:hypothetical protein BJ508DRAFT_415650 [Ascobolus immersus RN42]